MLAALRRRLDRLERRCNEALPAPLKVGALTLYLHAEGPSPRLDRLSAPAGWDRWHDIAVALLVALQVGGLALVTGAAWLGLTRTRATALNDPVNAVAVPGLNEFMPLAAAPYVVVALVVATVVHEGGHAVACRRADVPVAEYGVALLFGVVPLAAYVLPGDELDDAGRLARARVFAVGAANNLVVGVLALAVLWSPLTAGPGEAFLTYFGWPLTGGSPPTAAAVAALGPLTNLAFWTALLSINVGVLNALPVAVLDGGRVLDIGLDAATERFDLPLSPTARTAVVHAAGAVAVVGTVLAVVGPLLPV